jgi:hypothetical protein
MLMRMDVGEDVPVHITGRKKRKEEWGWHGIFY